MKRAIFLSGEICSGKDTTVENQYAELPYSQIDLGNLVREHFATEERVFSDQLEPMFIKRIQEIIAADDSQHGKGFIIYVITGLRQVTLLKKIAALFNVVDYVWLKCPRYILKERYASRAAAKDAKITFEEAIAGDESLGMKGLQNYLLTEVDTIFINTY